MARWLTLALAVALLGSASSAVAAAQEAGQEVPLGAGRPARPGITRTTIRDDSRVTVTRVHFEPGAAEEPHTHPYDIVVIPLESVPVQLVIGGKEMSKIEEGSPNFMGKGVVHFMKNTGTKPFAVIAVAIKQDEAK